MLPKPTTISAIIPGVSIETFGRKTGNWDLSVLTLPEHDRPPWWRDRCEMALRLVRERNAKRALKPFPYQFNARVCTRHKLTEVALSLDDVALRIGHDADGVVLPCQTAALHPTGDCPTIVIKDEDAEIVVSAHAGRDCLVDRAAIEKRSRGREYASVVDAMLARVKNRKAVRAAIICGIGPGPFGHPWDHPRHGERNRLLINHIVHRWGRGCILGHPAEGRINLAELILRQLVSRGARPERITHDGVDTYHDRDEGGDFLFHSHHRGDRERNLVLVTNME